MEQSAINGPMSNEIPDNPKRGIKDTIKNKITTAVFFGVAAIGGQAHATQEQAESKGPVVENAIEERESFEKLLMKNENILNEELARTNMETVKLGLPKAPFRCPGVQFGVYSNTGEHIIDIRCSMNDFKNSYKFLDFMKAKVIPNLAQGDRSKNQDGSNLEKVPNVIPLELLKIASMDPQTSAFFTQHELALTVKQLSPTSVGVCIERKKSSQLTKLADTLCYDNYAKQAKFQIPITLEGEKPHIRLFTFNLDGSKEESEFIPEYNASGILKNFTVKNLKTGK